MSTFWDGATQSSTLAPRYALPRHELADAAKRFDWASVFEILGQHQVFVNAWRLDGLSYYTPLHQAAFGNAPLDVVNRLIALGAWRTLPTAQRERPIDIALRQGHTNLLIRLDPDYKRHVSADQLAKIQFYFHDLIRKRAANLVDQYALRLPELAVLLELDNPEMWFPVAGMYGGFSFRLETEAARPKLIVESWSRVVTGSGRRHEITESGCLLVEEGFV